VAEPPLLAIAIDVDTPDDLRAVAACAGPATAAVLAQLGERPTAGQRR
jgi:hypothetical protein